MIDNASAPATDDAPTPITLQDFDKAKEELHNLIADLLFSFSAQYGQLPIEYKASLVEPDDEHYCYEGTFTLESVESLPEPPEQ
jgi:hypothetical protein